MSTLTAAEEVREAGGPEEPGGEPVQGDGEEDGQGEGGGASAPVSESSAPKSHPQHSHTGKKRKVI